MIRITKNMGKINSITRTPPDAMLSDSIDSFVIIPGVTTYTGIYSRGSRLNFVELTGGVIEIEFSTEGDLERFFSQLMREVKLNQILDINLDKGK